MKAARRENQPALQRHLVIQTAKEKQETLHSEIRMEGLLFTAQSADYRQTVRMAFTAAASSSSVVAWPMDSRTVPWGKVPSVL